MRRSLAETSVLLVSVPSPEAAQVSHEVRKVRDSHTSAEGGSAQLVMFLPLL